MNRADIFEIFRRLAELDPEPQTELEYRDPYTLLVAVALSAQATDVSVNKAMRKLFPVANTPAQIHALGVDGLIPFIQSIGLYRNKAKNVVEACRMLVELHGGRVSVESKGLGFGSTFTVTLPLVAAPRFEVKQVKRDDAGAPETPVRVLVVDDNRDAADAIALLLREMGHEPEVVYTPYAALELPGRCNADLVLLDIGMPGMDGYELARQLRASTKTAARFVALTGFGASDGARRALEAGFDEHLVKPVSGETLRRVLAKVK